MKDIEVINAFNIFSLFLTLAKPLPCLVFMKAVLYLNSSRWLTCGLAQLSTQHPQQHNLGAGVVPKKAPLPWKAPLSRERAFEDDRLKTKRISLSFPFFFLKSRYNCKCVWILLSREPLVEIQFKSTRCSKRAKYCLSGLVQPTKEACKVA